MKLIARKYFCFTTTMTWKWSNCPRAIFLQILCLYWGDRLINVILNSFVLPRNLLRTSNRLFSNTFYRIMISQTLYVLPLIPYNINISINELYDMYLFLDITDHLNIYTIFRHFRSIHFQFKENEVKVGETFL